MPVRFIVTAVLLLVAGPLRGKKDRNLVFGSRPRTSASWFGFAVEKESGRFRGVKFKAIREGGVALYLNRRLRSQVIHDLNTVNYCT